VVLTSSRSAGAYRRRLAGSPARGFVPKNELSGEALSALLT
jgi:two-component system nitrate/nitrite response regulator NarL